MTTRDPSYEPLSDAFLVDARREVAEFATAMEAKLRKNSHKTHWQTMPIEALRRLMMLEIEEFNVAREFFGPDEAMKELVDIGNYAMILRDRYRIEKERRSALSEFATTELTGPVPALKREGFSR